MGASLLAEQGLQTAQNVVNAGMGLLLGGVQDRRQVKQQKKLTDIQLAAQKNMANYNFNLQKEMWEATGYKAQKEQMKEAGLNAGLMYGMGGGGGQTTGSQGGSVTGATAAGGSGESIAAMGMGMNLQMLQADIKLKEAQTRNLNVEADNKEGVDREKTKAETTSLLQGVENAKAQKALTEVQTDIAEIQKEVSNNTKSSAIKYIEQEAQEMEQKVRELAIENDINQTAVEEKINIIRASLAGIWLENAMKKQGIENNATNMEAVRTKIKTDLANIRQRDRQLDQEQQKIALQTWATEMEKSFPGIGQVLGRVINSGIEQLNNILEGKNTTVNNRYKAP